MVDFLEKHCAKCGKVFIPAPQHIYKEGRKIYCSWTCYNHRKDGQGRQGYTRKMVAQYTLDGELVRIYETASKVAYVDGFTADNVRTACREGKAYKGYLWKYIESEGR